MALSGRLSGSHFFASCVYYICASVPIRGALSTCPMVQSDQAKNVIFVTMERVVVCTSEEGIDVERYASKLTGGSPLSIYI